MKIGYQGEPHSYSDRAAGQLFPDAGRVGYGSFAAAFGALESGEADRLVLPIENSTTGSVLPVLDRLVTSRAAIVAEHLMEIRHVLLALPGADLELIRRVRSHPEALAQAEDVLLARGWEPVPAYDTAGAVREVAARGDPSEAALATPEAGAFHGLIPLLTGVVDRPHNTTRFVVLARGEPVVEPHADKTSLAFETLHQPGALALALIELGLRGANLTRIESRPAEERWRYRFFVDFVHDPGPGGLAAVLEPPPKSMAAFRHLGTYPAVVR